MKISHGVRQRLVFGMALIVLVFASASLPAQVSLTIGQNFTGSSYQQDFSGLPPDSNGAIGPNHFVEFINGSFAVYQKSDGTSILQETDLKFWSDAGLIISPDSGISDPRVIFDPISQRWFASMVDLNATSTDPTTQANDFLLAVSTNSDPSGFWQGYKFRSDPTLGRFADFPTLGVDSNAVYLSGDFYQGESNPLGAGLVSIPKADLLANPPTIANRTWFGVMSYAQRGQVLQPAVCFDGSSSGNILSVANYGMDTNFYSNLVTFSVLNGATHTATLTASTTINVPPYYIPENDVAGAPLLTVVQPDGSSTLEANDARICGKVYCVGGILYATHNTELNGHIAIQWYRINAATHALLETGTISDPNLDLFFPCIAANAAGTVVIGCNAAGPSTFISCYAYVGQTRNGITTFNEPAVLQFSSVCYHGDDEAYADFLGTLPLSRWGDYNSISVDPDDPNRFWTIEMYASDTNVWSLEITELITAPTLLELTIARTGTNVLLSWPAFASDYVLQAAGSPVHSTNWSAVTATYLTNGNTISVQLPASGNERFFRLAKGP
jgi:hypothetical protein